jgi:hypothetical protein
MSSAAGGAAGIALGMGATGGAGTASGIGGGAAAAVGRRMRRTIFARAPCGFVFLIVFFLIVLLAVRFAVLRAGFRFAAFAFVRFFFDGAFARAFFLRAGAALRFGFRFAVVFRPRRPVAMSSLTAAHGRAIDRPMVRP